MDHPPGTLIISGKIHNPERLWTWLSTQFPLSDTPWKGLQANKPYIVQFRHIPQPYPETPDLLRLANAVLTTGGSIAWVWLIPDNDTLSGVDIITNTNNKLDDVRYFEEYDKNNMPIYDAMKNTPLILKSAHYTLQTIKENS